MAINTEQLLTVLSQSFMDFVEKPEKEVFRPFMSFPRSYQDWLEKPISLMHPFEHFSRWSEARLDMFFAELLYSPTFAAMLEQCPEVQEVPITFKQLTEINPNWTDAGGMYFPQFNAIAIDMQTLKPTDNPDYDAEQIDLYYEGFPEPMKKMFIIHELRHAFHTLLEFINTCPSVNTVDQMIANSFYQEAEVNAFQATVCWELAQGGIDEYWHAFKLHSPTLAYAFLEKVKENKMNAYNGVAQQAVFFEWFETKSKVDFYTDDLTAKLTNKDNELQFSGDIPRHNQRTNENTETKRPKSPLGLMPLLVKGELHDRENYLTEEGIINSDEFVLRNVSGKKLMAARAAFEEKISEGRPKKETRIAAIENLTR